VVSQTFNGSSPVSLQPTGSIHTGQSWWRRLFGWFDADYFPQGVDVVKALPMRDELRGYLPFLVMHVGSLAVFFTGISPAAVLVAISLYWVRMFAITAFYHRYFAHRTYKTSRWMQFIMALWANTSVQKGALWWASHHRHHHRHSDLPTDTHSALQRGFWWSHMGWVAVQANMPTDYDRIKDFAKFPELVWLNRMDWLGPALLLIGLATFGQLAPASWHTSGWQMVAWGFFLSTAVLYHGTFSINSLAHVWGTRRYKTADESRNNLWLALITMGEGWHNNHHFYQGTVRQGFYWWEVDVTFYILKVASWFGLVWDLHPVPKRAYAPQAGT
jgi:stearoyl-CoA desaturase (Delta-9 desaturase)